MANRKYIERPAMSREDVIVQAVRNCLDIMYRASYPSTTLEEVEAEVRKHPVKGRDGLRMFERHYLPQGIHQTILEDVADAYELRSQLPEIIEVLKNYFAEPIVDKWIEGENAHDPGHRGYEHPEPMPDAYRAVAGQYMDMANDFFNWNADLNKFYFNVCNVSPSSNRDTVEKWHHEHGEPDFKLPEDDYWVDGWDDSRLDEEDDHDERENE